MNIIVNITKSFDNHYNTLTEEDQELVKRKINSLMEYIKKGRLPRRGIEKLNFPGLPGDMKSTLYSYRVNLELRLLLTYDDDPLFDQYVITLCAISNYYEATDKIIKVSNSLYHDLINRANTDEKD